MQNGYAFWRASWPRSRSDPALADDHLTLEGRTIGVAVVGTQHFWDREAFNGAVETVEALGGSVRPSMAGATTRCMPTTTTSCAWPASMP